MDQTLTLFTWFCGILFLLVLVLDILITLKFRRYFLANGYGLVTLTLVSLVASHAVATILFGTTALAAIITSGKAARTIYVMKDLGTFWLVSSELVHIMGISFQRLLSCSLPEEFSEIAHSQTSISISIGTMWIVPLIMTLLCVTSGATITHSVFYIGLLICGSITVANFALTIDTSFNSKRSISEEDFDMNVLGRSTPKNMVHVTSNPRKTFTLFSGLVFTFILFVLPTSIPNLIYTLQGETLKASTSLVVCLWLFLGVVVDSLWIAMRLRSTVNDSSGFYARWTLGRKSDAGIAFIQKLGGDKDSRVPKNPKQYLLHRRDSLDSKGQETEVEHI